MSGFTSSAERLIGRVLGGRFQVVSFIREGGMAQVFCGSQPREPRHVAIKVVHPELSSDREIVARFMREAKVASRLDHPNIVRTIDCGQDGDLIYMVMELLLGDDLSARIRLKGSFIEQRAVEIVIDVLTALHYAHQRGVVHRDVKPENVIICRQPDNPAIEQVKVLDFGIAKVLDARPDAPLPTEAPTSVRSVLTRVGTWVGTPSYMSPEQGRADPIDHRSDIYSAAVLLYELLCGRPLFDGETPLQIVARHVHDPPPPLHPFNPNVHPILEGLVLRALEKDPANRPQTAEDMANELRQLLPDLSQGSSQRWSTLAPSSRSPHIEVTVPSSRAPGSLPSSDGVPTRTHTSEGPTQQHDARSLKALKSTMAIEPHASAATPSPPKREQAHPLIGRLLEERYQVASFIREGGMAQVFCGLSEQEPHHVAIKVVHPELARDPEIVARFLREAQIASRLTHPNIVRVLSVGEDQDMLYLVMELLFGDDLSARVKQRGTFSVLRSVEIAAQVLAALHHAHQQGVIHRDIKPENVMLCRQPDAPAIETVKVLDFGIAKVLDQKKDLAFPVDAPTAVRSVLTRVGALVGTPTYISPEQGRTEPVDHRADLYSVGVLLYELLCGRPPFTGETALQIVARHVHEAPPRLSDMVQLPNDLEALVLRALAKSPADRPASAQEFGAELLDIASRLSGRAGPAIGPTQRSQAAPSVRPQASAPVAVVTSPTPASPPPAQLSPTARTPAITAPSAPAYAPQVSARSPLSAIKETLPLTGNEANAMRAAAAQAVAARQAASQAGAQSPPSTSLGPSSVTPMPPQPSAAPPHRDVTEPQRQLEKRVDAQVNRLMRVVIVLGALLVVTLTVVAVLIALVVAK